MIQQLTPVAPETHESREAWLGARKSMIGASDTAGIFGVGYASQSPVTVWHSKVSDDQPEIEPAQLKRMELGRKMEPIISDLFAEETGLRVEDPGDFTIWRHPSIPWLGATLDRIAIHDDFGPVPAEIKHVNGRFRGDWDTDEEPPLKYMVQVQHQMAVVSAERAYLVGLVGGDELVVRLIDRNDRFIDAMIERLQEFWGYVQRREMPPVDESEATRALLSHIWPRDSGLTVSLPNEATDWDRQLLELKDEIKGLESRRNLIENQIKAAIGQAAVGFLPHGGSYSWKTQQRKGYVVEPGESRVLRRSSK